MDWTRKDLVDIESLSPSEIQTLLNCAQYFKKVCLSPKKHAPLLQGYTVANFFVEPSTRTRTSFELAAKHLGATVVNLSAESSSLKKGETLKDTVLNLQALQTDVLVMRHSASGAPQFVAERVRSAVLNGGDGAHEHPTQGFLDALTILDKKGSFKDVRVTILGDILYSRVARSNIWLLTKMGALVTLCGPPTLVPMSFEKMGCKVSHKVEDAIADADFVNLLRIQHERQRKSAFPSLGEYTSFFGLTQERVRLMKPDATIMHPGPINRGVEIDSEVADCGRSVILNQVTNGLAVRMAALYLVTGHAPSALKDALESMGFDLS